MLDKYIANWLSFDGMHRLSASADVFHVIADQTRRGILDLLAAGERPAKELEARFSISQPSISKHLAVLKEAGLVSHRREGRMRIYRLEADGLQEIFDWVHHYERFWDLKLEGLGRYLDLRKRTKK